MDKCCICWEDTNRIVKRCYQCVEGIVCDQCISYCNKKLCPICNYKNWESPMITLRYKLTHHHAFDKKYKSVFEVFNRNKFPPIDVRNNLPNDWNSILQKCMSDWK